MNVSALTGDGADVPYRPRMCKGVDTEGGPILSLTNAYFATFAWKRDFPWCVNYALWYADAGLPRQEEHEAMNVFTEALLDDLRRQMTVLDVGRVSGSGQRETWYYVADRERATAVIESYLAAHPSRWTFDYAISRDDTWSHADQWLSDAGAKAAAPAVKVGLSFPLVESVASLWRGLTEMAAPVSHLTDPGDYPERAADLAVLAQLDKAGANRKTTTNVRFYCYFRRSAAAVDAQVECLAMSYSAEVRLPLSPFGAFAGAREYLVVVETMMMAAIENIATVRFVLGDVVGRHGGSIDGWEAALMR